MKNNDDENPIPDLIEEITGRIGKIVDKLGHQPNEGAQASIELTSEPWANGVNNSIAQGTLYIELAADHFFSLRRAFIFPVLTISPWSAARNVLEASALSNWLLDTSIGAQERSARSSALRYEGLVQQEKYSRSSGEKDHLAMAEARTSELVDSVVDIGHAEILNKRGKRIGLATKLPKSTELVETFLGKGSEYRLCSAMLHGHHWATQQLGFKSVRKENVPFLEKSISPIVILYLSQVATIAFAKSLGMKFDFFGWNKSEVESSVLVVLKKIDKLMNEDDSVSDTA
jgi:hypothetical protein